MKKIIFILVFLFVVCFGILGTKSKNSSIAYVWNHINNCIKGQAHFCNNVKMKVKKELCACANKLKYVSSFNPPKMIFENSIVFAIVAYIMSKALGITLNEYNKYMQEVSN